MFSANIIFIGICANLTATNSDRRRFNFIANFIWKHNRAQVNRQNIKPVNIGNSDKPGCLGHDMGRRRHVFQRSIIGRNLHHLRPV